MNSWTEVKAYIENLLKPGLTNTTNVQKLLNSFQAIINLLNAGSMDPENDAEWKPGVTYARDVEPVLWRDSWLVSNIANNLGIPPINDQGTVHPAWRVVNSSSGSGIRIWRPLVYPNVLEIVFYEGGLYYLDRNETGSGPFLSANFEEERALNQWVQLTGDHTHQIADIEGLQAELDTFTRLPFGLAGQLYKLSGDNTNETIPEDLLKSGNYVSTDEQLTDSQSIDGVFLGFADVFANWRRFAHGGSSGAPGVPSLTNTIPSAPSLTQSWVLSGNQVVSTFNTGAHVGFVSDVRLVNFDLRATLSSSHSDNDYIGIVIAFVEDQNDMVVNNAFGLDPLTHVGINVSDELIPNQHTLTLLRGREGGTRYVIVYNYQKLDQKYLVLGDSLPWATNSNWSGNSVDVRVVRNGDLISVFTSDYSDAPGGKGELRFELTFDLTSDPDTQKFRGPSRYGYSAHSQQNATFSNIEISGSGINEIYDLRNGDIWVADGAGVWSVDAGRTLWSELLARTLVYNPRYTAFYWFVEAGNYIQISSAGVPGPEGPAGPQGIQGIQGEQGIQGPPGADGTEVAATEVRDKLLELEGENRLPVSAIKDGNLKVDEVQFEFDENNPLDWLKIARDSVPTAGSSKFVNSGNLFTFLLGYRAALGENPTFAEIASHAAVSYREVLFTGSSFVMVSSSGQRITRSEDGFHFYNPTSPNIATWGLIQLDDVLIGIAETGAGSNAMRSADDGRTWTQVSTGIDATFRNGASGRGVAVMGATSGLSGRAVYSTDKGVTWNTSVLETEISVNGVVEGGGVFLLLASGTVIQRSVDGGINFSNVTVSNRAWTKGISFNGLFILFASSGTSSKITYSSDLGLTWTDISSPDDTVSFTRPGIVGRYCYVGGTGGFLMRSLDGINWQAIPSGTSNNIQSIAGGRLRGKDIVIIVCDNGTNRFIRSVS